MTEPDGYKVYEADLTDFQPDADNANQGTERGAGMIRKSIQEVGPGRSLVADKNNVIPAGNKTQEAAVDVGITKAIVVETDGDAVIIHKRRDWDLSDKDPNNPARKYAYYDNRTSEVDLSFDPAQIAADLGAGVDLSGLWYDWELSNIVLGGDGEIDPTKEWQGMPEFENEDAFGAIATVKVHFASEEAIGEFARLVEQTVTKESKFIWYPKQERENLKQYIAKDES